MKQIKINEKDNVAVMLEGKLSGHKIALNDIKKGENIINTVILSVMRQRT